MEKLIATGLVIIVTCGLILVGFIGWLSSVDKRNRYQAVAACYEHNGSHCENL